jgi:hypothetical protein
VFGRSGICIACFYKGLENVCFVVVDQQPCHSIFLQISSWLLILSPQEVCVFWDCTKGFAIMIIIPLLPLVPKLLLHFGRIKTSLDDFSNKELV